jgi:hypothetical protein
MASRSIWGFRYLVQKHFNYLVTDYGFKLTNVESSVVDYTSPVCRVHVMQEFANTGVLIGPPDDDPSKYTSKSRYLNRIVQFKEGSKDAFRFRRYDDPSYDSDPEGIIDRDLANMADLLRRYCDDMLRGDFSLVAAIDP